MTFTIPELSLVVLIGPSGCDKSTFARKHFKPTEGDKKCKKAKPAKQSFRSIQTVVEV